MPSFKLIKRGGTYWKAQANGKKYRPGGPHNKEFIKVYVLEVYPERREVLASIGGAPATTYPQTITSRWLTQAEKDTYKM